LTSPDPISPTEHRAPEIGPEIAPEIATSRAGALSPENPPWTFVDVLIIAVVGFLILAIFGILAVAIAHSLSRFRGVSATDLAQNAMVFVPAQTVASLLVVGFMVEILRLKRQDDFLIAISWKMPDLSGALVAVAGGVGLAFCSLAFNALLSRWMPRSLPIDKLFRDASSAYLLSFYGVLVAPLVEELFFRGFLYPALARRIGMGVSVVLTAATFAVIHQGQLAHAWLPLSWLFIVGSVLTLVRARIKSVATCVIIHVAYNATIFVLVFIGTQGFHHMEHVT